MRTYSTVVGVVLLIGGVSVLQANKRPTHRLPGFKVMPGMPCPTPSCVGRVHKKNGTYQCNRCYATIEPT